MVEDRLMTYETKELLNIYRNSPSTVREDIEKLYAEGFVFGDFTPTLVQCKINKVGIHPKTYYLEDNEKFLVRIDKVDGSFYVSGYEVGLDDYIERYSVTGKLKNTYSFKKGVTIDGSVKRLLVTRDDGTRYFFRTYDIAKEINIDDRCVLLWSNKLDGTVSVYLKCRFFDPYKIEKDLDYMEEISSVL